MHHDENHRNSTPTRTTRRRWPAVLGISVAAFGLAAPSAAAGGPKERPYKETGSQTGTLQCFDVECEGFAIDLVGSGVATHLGAYTLVSNDTNVWTAANGDTLISNVNVSEPLDPGDVACEADEYPAKSVEYFEGGTGRFAEATGSYVVRSCLRIVGEFDQTGTAPVELRYWTDGTITF